MVALGQGQSWNGNSRCEHLTCGVEPPHVQQPAPGHQRGLRSPALRGKDFVSLSLWGSVLKEPWELAQAAAC